VRAHGDIGCGMDTRQADDSRIGDARSVFPCEQAACEDIGALMVSTPVCTETVDSSVMMGPCVQAALGAHRSPDENQVDHPEQRQLSRAVSTSRDINTSVEPIPLESSSAQPRSRSQKSDYKVLPAPSLVEVALGSIDNLDFPRVTEICERLEMEPGELDETVHILVATLGGKQDAHLRMKLRALTISNELMYSTHAVEAFRKVHGLQEALQGLRGVHDTELGEVTDQNVRMLATEIDRVCFGQSSSCVTTIPTSTSSNELLGWQGGSLESNLERLAHARQKARDAFAIAGRKAEQTMLKAERAVDRTAKLVFQEAERTWEGLVGDDSSSVPRKKDKGKESLQQRRKRVAMEDHQLQWALNASLEEEATRQRQQVTAEQQPQHQQQGQQRFQRQQQELHQQQQHQQQQRQQQQQQQQQQQPSVGTVSRVEYSVGTCGNDSAAALCAAFGGNLQGSVDEVSRRLCEAEDRVEVAKQKVALLAVRDVGEANEEDFILLKQLESSEGLLAGLVESMSHAEDELDRINGRAKELEAKLIRVSGGAALVCQLRMRVAELERIASQRQPTSSNGKRLGIEVLGVAQQVLPDSSDRSMQG